ncbi:MAG TPA: alpha/beta fold hydrolase [Oculatellaceae cyanobacterium]|jgi:dipeptidyl aminopeptidase/acylaminoacyl peptidase
MKIRLIKAFSIALSFSICSTIFPPQAYSQTEVEPSPSSNLVVDGIPKIPASLIQKVGQYSNFRYSSFSSWHPTKLQMLIATRIGNTTQAYQVDSPGSSLKQLTDFPDAVGNVSYEPRQGNYFIFSKAIGGNEAFQFYRYDEEDGKITLLTDGKSRNTHFTWSNRDSRIAYASTKRNGKDVDIYIMNPTDPQTDRLLMQVQGGGWIPLSWSPDDKKILVREGISASESYLWIVDVATGEKTLITPKRGTEKIVYGDAQFSKDGKGIYVTTDRDSEFLRLAYIDIATKQVTLLTKRINWDVEDFAVSQNGKTIAFVTNEDGISRLHLLDTSPRKEKPVPKVPVGVISNLRWHKNGKELGFNFVSARSTPDAYSLNLQTGKLFRWTKSDTGGVNTQNFSYPELVRWKSFDGKVISGFLYKAPASFKGKRPVLIDIHGGPELQARPIFINRANYYLNELGVNIIFPNIRGSSGYGKTFLKLANGLKREDAYKDLGALLDWIKTRPELDANRVLVGGTSYGGYMSLSVAAFYSDRIRAAQSVAGMSNLVSFLENTGGYRQDLRRAQYGDERDPKVREFLERISPINNAHKIKKPLFIVQGGNDPRVPKSEAEQMVAKVKSNNIPVWYLLAQDEGHGFVKKKNSDFQFYSTVMFVQQYLLDSPIANSTPKSIRISKTAR